MQNTPITVHTVLLGSAALLRLRGRTIGTMVAPDGRMCIVGAIETFIAESGITDSVVVGNLRDDAVNRVTRTIWGEPSGAAHPHVTAWNDRACASDEQAAEMLERAARAGS